MKFKVHGTTVVSVTVEVEADDEDGAFDAACEEFDGLTSYAGNGGLGKLVGTSNRKVTLDPGEDCNFTQAEPA